MSLTFLSPLFLWALLGVPLVVFLHFLRTRRRTLVVSALFLWQRATEEADRRRRFSPTWLLILQILFVTLAALALARPVLSLSGPPPIVVIVDASASMTARAASGSRLDEAKELANELISRGGEVAIVRAGLDAEVISPLDSDRTSHRRVLSELTGGDREADLGRALELANSIAPDAQVHLITDAPAPGGQHVVHSVGDARTNLGIVTFETGLGQAYLAVASNDERPRQVPVVLLRDGAEIGRTDVLVSAQGRGNVTFPLVDGGGVLQARLEVGDDDALDLDDIAFAGERSLRVTVEEENGPLLRALNSIPGLQVSVGGTAAGADLRVVFDDLTREPPAGPVIQFATRSENPSYLEIRDWAQGDPVFRFVDFQRTVVGLSQDRASEVGEAWQVLARASDLSPVITRLARPGGDAVRFHFHPGQSDMVLRPAFPTLLTNLVEVLRGESTVTLGAVLPPGSTLSGAPVDRALVPGIYDTPDGRLAASLLAVDETTLPAPAQPATEPEVTVTEPGTIALANIIWTVLLAVAAALLLAEWFAWSRTGSARATL